MLCRACGLKRGTWCLRSCVHELCVVAWPLSPCSRPHEPVKSTNQRINECDGSTNKTKQRGQPINHSIIVFFHWLIQSIHQSISLSTVSWTSSTGTTRYFVFTIDNTRYQVYNTLFHVYHIIYTTYRCLVPLVLLIVIIRATAVYHSRRNFEDRFGT